MERFNFFLYKMHPKVREQELSLFILEEKEKTEEEKERSARKIIKTKTH